MGFVLSNHSSHTIIMNMNLIAKYKFHLCFSFASSFYFFSFPLIRKRVSHSAADFDWMLGERKKEEKNWYHAFDAFEKFARLRTHRELLILLQFKIRSKFILIFFSCECILFHLFLVNVNCVRVCVCLCMTAIYQRCVTAIIILFANC